MQLTTSRLCLQPLTEDKCQEWFNLSQDNGLTSFQISNYKMPSTEVARQWIQEKNEYLARNGIGIIGIFLKHGNILIGICALKYLDEEKSSPIEIMYRLSQDYWGQGYATEVAQGLIRFATAELKLKTLVATVDEKNIPSEKILIKLGFIFKKTIKILNFDEKLYELSL